MHKTWIQWGMPITVEVVDKGAGKAFKLIKDYFAEVDQKFSTYRKDSEISLINDERLMIKESSDEMKLVFKLAEQTKQETEGFFDIYHQGKIDPSGIVKGWAIKNAADLLKSNGFKNFFIDAGGDIQTAGLNADGLEWSVGIRNPFNPKQIIKILSLSDKGIATSGTYNRGQHVYNPHQETQDTEITSITVIGPNVYEADRFATAALAMGSEGIYFIEQLSGFEGYQIDDLGQATFTSNFEEFVR